MLRAIYASLGQGLRTSLMSKFPILALSVFLQIGTQSALAQSSVEQPLTGQSTVGAAPAPESAVLSIKAQFDSQYILAKTNPAVTELTSPGTLLVVRKENLILNRVLLNSGKRSTPVQNVYENGAISQAGLLGALSKLNSFLGGSRPDNISRALDLGTRVWVTYISVQTSGIEFRLMSDPIANQRFHGVLRFPISDSVEVDKVPNFISEALAIDQPPTSVANSQVSVLIADETQQTRQAAESGNPEAMFQLANVLVQRGENVDAVRWFERASDIGHTKASNALGYMYNEGRGVPQNFVRASALYLRAMKGGDVDAMINRGLLILNGNGVNKDSQQAHMHFLLAAAYARDNDARNAAIKLKTDTEARLTKQQITRSQAMADKFAKEEMR